MTEGPGRPGPSHCRHPVGVTRNRKLVLLLAAAVAAALVAVVAIAVSSGGGSSTTTTSTTSTGSFLAGVPQHGETLGDPSAAATLVVFEDPQCPYCREWSLGALPTVVKDFVRTGRVKLVWRGIEIIGPNSIPGLRAAYAAAEQNKLWNFVDALYNRQGAENSGWITTPLLQEAAKAAGVNATKMLAASSTPTVLNALKASTAESVQDNVQGTPSFVLQKGPAVTALQVTSLDAAGFSAALGTALQ